MSELLQLRIAMAHRFKERGDDGNLPPARCLLCGLLRADPVHDDKNVVRQGDRGESHVALAALNWRGPK